jgi:hypothetical protein
LARFLNLWRLNPVGAWPTDPSKYLELQERMWADIDGLMKKGEIEEFGVFPDGTSGYYIVKGETADLYRNTYGSQCYVLSDVREIIPYEKHKEILGAVLRSRIATAQK